MPSEQADLIVVGASVGGLAAAVSAADRGCRAIVVERTKELGGGAASESEVIAAAGSRFQQAAGIVDAPDRLAADVVAATRHHVDPALVTALAEQGAPLVAWLGDRCGVAIELVSGYAGVGHSVARLHLPGERGGASLVADLARAATRRSRVNVRTGTVADRLIRDETGAVRGVQVRAERRGVAVELLGDVLLACGGFVGDETRMAEHCPAAGRLAYHGTTAASGDALRLAAEVGACTARLAACRVAALLAMPGGLAVTAPIVAFGAILVNQAGRRFVDETVESLRLAQAIHAQPGHLAYLLFDERIASAAREADPFFARVVLPRAGRRGVTLKDLARQFELPLEALTLTIDTYNGNLELGGDPFGRDTSDGELVAPFHAIRVTSARWRTLGGLSVDGAARVLAAEGQPIPGLYAAGGAAVGLGGDGTEGALPGLDALSALGLARLAALDVVARAAARGGESV